MGGASGRPVLYGLVGLVVAGLVLPSLPARGHAPPGQPPHLVDQQVQGGDECTRNAFPGRAPIGSELTVVAQGFTPRYGRLTAVDLCLDVLASAEGATLTVVELDEQGQVARQLAEQSFTPRGPNLLGTGVGWNHVDLATPARVVPGTRYELRLTAPRLLFQWQATCGGLLSGCADDDPDRYVGGGATPIGDPADFGFRTWTDRTANLAVADVSAPPLVCPDTRSLADITVTVANTGGQAVAAFDVALHVGGGPAVGTTRVGGLGAGERHALPASAFGLTDPLVVGDGRTHVRAVIDPADEVVESDEGDNTGNEPTTAVPCQPSALRDLDVGTDIDTVRAGLVRLPWTDLDPRLVSGSVDRFAEVTASPFHATPFHATPFRASPFHATPFRASPFHASPFRASPFHASPFRASPFHASPFHAAQLDVLLAAVPDDVLDGVPLASVPSTVDWSERLRAHAEAHEGTATADQARALLEVPTQDRTLADVLRTLDPPLPIGLHEVDLGQVFDLSMLGLALAAQPLATIPAPDGHDDWCAAVAAVSHLACATTLDPAVATPLTLDLHGVPMTQFRIRGIVVADIAPRALTPLFDVPLADPLLAQAADDPEVGQPYRVSHTSLGARAVEEALADPAALVPACAEGCPELTLADVEAAYGFAEGTRLADLIDGLAAGVGDTFDLADALLGFVALADLPWGRFDSDVVDAVTIGDAVGASCPRVTWTASGTVVDDGGHAPVVDPTLTVSLPRGFAPDLDAVTATVDGQPAVVRRAVPDTADARTRVRVTVDAIATDHVAVSVPACAAATLGPMTGQATATWPTFDSDLAIVEGVLADPTATARVLVGERDEPDTPEPALPLAHEALTFRHVSGETDLDWYDIPLGTDLGDGTTLDPGDRLRVFLAPPTARPTDDPDTPVPGADLDLVLFAPGTSPLRDAPFHATPFHATNAPIVPVEDTGTTDNTYGTQAGDTLDDLALQTEPVEAAPFRASPFRASPFHASPVRDVSTNRGDEAEFVEVVVRPGETSGTYTVQVSGHDGDQSDRPYVLWYQVLDAVPVLGACTPPDAVYQPVSAGGPARPGADTETLLLVDETALRAAAGPRGDEVMARLDALAAHDRVNGTVVAYDRDPEVAELVRAWRTTDAWCDPVAANRIVGALRGIVAQAEQDSPNLQHVVVVGADDLTPMLRTWDGTDVANERAYLAEHLADLGAENGPSLAALAAGTVMTDDALGGGMPLPWQDDAYWVPELSVGRLGETVDDIIAQVDQFLVSDGVLDRGTLTGLVTGYDFLTDGSQRTADHLTGGGVDTTELIRDDWTAADLLAALGDRDTDRAVAILNGHADPTRLLTAAGDFAVRGGAPLDPGEIVSTGDVDDRALGRVVAAASCHFGLNVVDTFAGEAGDPARRHDWVQELAGRNAIVLANTGYGYGTVGEAPGLSEALVADLAEQLFIHDTVGEAWAAAKQRYAATSAVYGWHHRKAGLELVLHGLPMYRFSQDPTGAHPPEPVEPIVDGFTDLDVVPLSTGDLPVAHGACDDCLRLRHTSSTEHRGSWLEVVGDVGPGVLAVEGQPLVAQATRELDLAGRTAGGLFVTGMQMQDVAVDGDPRGFDPLFVRPLISAADREPETQALGAAFPATAARATTVADRTTVSIPMARFRGADVRADGEVVGQMTALTRVDGLLYLRDEATSDLVPPAMRSVRLVRTEGAGPGGEDRITIAVHVSDVSDVARVAAGLRIVHGGVDEFRPLELGQAEGTEIDVDGGGTIVASRWTTSTLVPAGASLEVVLAQAVDGVGNVATHHDKLVTPLVDDGTGTEPVDTIPPEVVFVRPSRSAFEAGVTVVSGQDRPLEIACLDAGFGVASCTWQILDDDGSVVASDTPDRLVTDRIGIYTIEATAVDHAGNTTIATVSYRVESRFVFLGFDSPLTAFPQVVEVNAGSTVPSKFQLVDDGEIVSDPAEVVLRWFDLGPVAADGRCEVPARDDLDARGPDEAEPVTSNPPLRFDDDRFIVNAETSSSWEGTCRVLTAEAADGLRLYAVLELA